MLTQYQEDSITIEILTDGSVKITTDPISSANHANADQMLVAMEKAMGGDTKIVKRDRKLEQKQIVKQKVVQR